MIILQAVYTGYGMVQWPLSQDPSTLYVWDKKFSWQILLSGLLHNVFAASIWQFFQEATEENICEMFYLYLFETISMRSQRLQSRVAQLPESERMVMVLMMVQEDLMVHILDKMFIDLCFY